MGVTYAKGSVTGRTAVREYDFLVDTGATWVGLSQAGIDALGLDIVPNAGATLLMADGTVSRTPSLHRGGYAGRNRLRQRRSAGRHSAGRLQAATGLGVQS